MTKIISMNFSYAENSMQQRGIKLMNQFIPFTATYSMTDFNMPVCYSNNADGIVPQSVEEFDLALSNADAFVFAISEMTSHYCATFKNALDWLVVKTNYNSTRGAGYSISNKPLVVVTFSPSYIEGNRHFEMTSQLLLKLKVDIRGTYCFNDCWEQVRPNNYNFVKKQSLEILEKLLLPANPNLPDLEENKHKSIAKKWQQQYKEWDESWRKNNEE